MSDKPIRLLLVDDEEDLVAYLAKRFKMKGFEVCGVGSGPAAIEEAAAQTFDVAVIDLKMPEMDGVEVLKALKRQQPFMQVIMLTGHGSIESALESGKSDAYRYLAKPYEFEKLVAIVGEAHASKRKQQRECYQEALNELIQSSTSPHEIVSETDRLRREYEQ